MARIPLLAPAAADVLVRLPLSAGQPDRLRLLSVLLGGKRSVVDNPMRVL